MPQALSNTPAQAQEPGIPVLARENGDTRSPSRNPNQRLTLFAAPRPLTLWHLASLDAPTVALVWSLSFAWVAHVHLPFWVPALQVLAVWAVYIGDRLLDARSGLRSARFDRLRERHFFHWRHRRILIPLAAIAAFAAAWVFFFLLPTAARERNSLLAIAALAYFTRVHTGRTLHPLLSSLFSKELLVGLLFTGGCALPAWSHSPGWTLFCPVAFFAALAWLNCHAIDRWESQQDTNGKLSINAEAVFICIAGLALVAFLFTTQPRSAAILATGAGSALMLAILDRLRSRIAPVTLRTAADLALLAPVLLLPFTLSR